MRRSLVRYLWIPVLLCLVLPAEAWERGNHAETWQPGQTIKVCVDTPPGDAAQQQAFNDAVQEAMKEWNEAQKAFGGLKLESATEGCDVQVGWEANADSWGSVGAGTGPVPVTIESNDGLNARGVTRVLKHELGHVEGLGHSSDSDLMAEDAYSSTEGESPSADDLNSEEPFTDPTDDDKNGKKELYGTEEEKLKKPKSESRASLDVKTGRWSYQYVLSYPGKVGPERPVTGFTLDLRPGTGPSDFEVNELPKGWGYEYLAGGPVAGRKQLDRSEMPSPSLLAFSAEDRSAGLTAGGSIAFEITSRLPPSPSRAFTSSPGYDSAELFVKVPERAAEAERPPAREQEPAEDEPPAAKKPPSTNLWMIATIVLAALLVLLLLRRR